MTHSVSLSVLGTPVKVRVRWFAFVLASFSPVLEDGGPTVGVEVERPQRSEDERPRGRRRSAIYSVGEGRRRNVVVQVICRSCERTWCGRRVRACQRPYLGPRTMVRRHDDRWGARCAGKGAAAHSFRDVHPAAGWRQETYGSWPQASAELGAGHAYDAWLGGHLLPLRARHGQGGISERAQGVIAAPQDLALHRQRRVLAVLVVVFGRQLVVVAVIGGTAPSRGLGGLERSPPQLG